MENPNLKWMMTGGTPHLRKSPKSRKNKQLPDPSPGACRTVTDEQLGLSNVWLPFRCPASPRAGDRTERNDDYNRCGLIGPHSFFFCDNFLKYSPHSSKHRDRDCIWSCCLGSVYTFSEAIWSTTAIVYCKFCMTQPFLVI